MFGQTDGVYHIILGKVGDWSYREIEYAVLFWEDTEFFYLGGQKCVIATMNVGIIRGYKRGKNWYKKWSRSLMLAK